MSILSLLNLAGQDCAIRHQAICARCEQAELSKLDLIKHYRCNVSRQTAVWAGHRMEFVASVVTGMATIGSAMETGRTQMVGLFGPSAASYFRATA